MDMEQYKNAFDNMNAEKIALDRQYVRKLHECVSLETSCVKLEMDCEKLKKENDVLKKHVEDLRNKIADSEISVICDAAVAS